MEYGYCFRPSIIEPCGLERIGFQLDPYIGCGHLCRYCYALETATTDWSRKILMHRDLETRLAGELGGLNPQKVYLGYNTDPYQPCEAELKQTKAILQQLQKGGFSASILTKSDLIQRDYDILREMTDATVSFSVAFQQEDDRRNFEDGTMETRRRVAALAEAKAAGIKTNVLICPVIPYIGDAVALLEAVYPHADLIWIYGLNIRL